jgi:hypothetical protein
MFFSSFKQGRTTDRLRGDPRLIITSIHPPLVPRAPAVPG